MELKKVGIMSLAAFGAITIGAIGKVLDNRHSKKNLDAELDRIHEQANTEIQKSGTVSENTQAIIKKLQGKL